MRRHARSRPGPAGPWLHLVRAHRRTPRTGTSSRRPRACAARHPRLGRGPGSSCTGRRRRWGSAPPRRRGWPRWAAAPRAVAR
eukprot:scaffold98240_cov66-Phaeocystis_antarctica.AAC.2